MFAENHCTHVRMYMKSDSTNSKRCQHGKETHLVFFFSLVANGVSGLGMLMNSHHLLDILAG